RGESQEVDPARGDVFADEPRSDPEAALGQFREQLLMDQMNLAQVWLAGIALHARAVLDRFAHVRVALDPQAGQEPDDCLVGLRERVRRATADGYDFCCHRCETP